MEEGGGEWRVAGGWMEKRIVVVKKEKEKRQRNLSNE